MMKTKGIKTIMWICISVLTLQFLGAGISKLAGNSWTAKFTDWGYPVAFMYAIGLLEILGVAGLFFTRIRKWSAIVFILLMSGAAYTHISNSEYIRVIHNAIVAALSFLVIRLNQEHHNKHPEKNVDLIE